MHLQLLMIAESVRWRTVLITALTVTQQNAALVEEVAAATESLKNQASNLAHDVSVFKMERSVSVVTNPTNVRPTSSVQQFT